MLPSLTYFTARPALDSRSDAVPPFQGGGKWLGGSQAFSLGCHMTGFQPFTAIAKKNKSGLS